MTISHPPGRYQRLPAQQSIRVFEAAARHLSFTLAGQELAMTQSGVSKQIKGLEAFLGVSLFVREGHQISLTDAGRLFYQRCSQALDCLQQAVNEVQGEKGRIRLQAPPTFAARWLIPRMEQLRRSYPQLDLHIETTWLRTINDRIQIDGGELVIHACRQYPFDDLHCELLRREWLGVLVSPDYLARHGPIERPEDLIGQTLIHTRLDGHIHWQAWAQAMGLDALDTEQGYEFETLDMALSAAENGIGVVVGDLLYVLDRLASGQLVIPFRMPIMEGLCYMLLSQPGRKFQSLQDTYRNWLGQQLAADEQRMFTLLEQLGFDPSQRLQASV
ncbi:LysR substrate-binding domain-containing protein [Marinobacterium arenosum]|uniref:LysR substrate-binding domain-containing protein n=1 Tax=Marinobacterium arenosum TaxID=2862496 RepID=UPI001C9727C3|nr:LysR substrate-binding domain-containing protein [Marinobacterium arenosum]MBY4675411.1 LysR family transcriptional regulator [Marinobacterium arenosum]